MKSYAELGVTLTVFDIRTRCQIQLQNDLQNMQNKHLGHQGKRKTLHVMNSFIQLQCIKYKKQYFYIWKIEYILFTCIMSILFMVV